ncbi:MAG: HipA domain-containing protein [Gemmatimonadota bacterium]|nr:HipA domain-containing protein [Gemmatimonadota bacterium]
MANPYTVLHVRPEWALEPEDMGTKTKFWYRDPDDDADWLFKHPRTGTGEHWAEKIVAEVAGLLVAPCATVQFAEWEGVQASASKSFVSGRRELVHGNQILKWTFSDYDPAKRFRQSEHSIENIWRCFGAQFRRAEAAEAAKTQFAGYLVLDAVVGNTDRHHENWGVVRERRAGRWVGRLAPSFDHASSLGRELRDEKRMMRLEAGSVPAYAEKARGAIYLGGSTGRGPSPLDLVRGSMPTIGRYFRAPLERLSSLRDSDVGEIMDRIPAGWMSTPAKEFAASLIRYNRDRLLELLR